MIIVHHGNRQGGARGIGRAEDALDLVIKLAKPQNYSPSEGARFKLSYEKARGIPGGSALDSFEATLTPQGWIYGRSAGESIDQKARRKVLEVVTAASLRGEPFQTKTAAVEEGGGQRKKTMAVWDALVSEGVIEQRADPEGYHPAAE